MKYTYEQKIILAIGSLSPGRSSPASRAAIKKWISANYPIKETVSSGQLNTYLRNAIKKGVEKGYVSQMRQSFKLTESGRDYRKKLLKETKSSKKK